MMKIKKLNEILETEKEKKIFQDIVYQLDDIDIDGESTQQLLKDIGMEDQMLKQLVRTYPVEAFEHLIDLSDEGFLDDDFLDKFLIKVTENPEFHKKLSDLLIKLDANKYNI